MNTIRRSGTDYWLKRARESWFVPFMAGTLGGLALFWI